MVECHEHSVMNIVPLTIGCVVQRLILSQIWGDVTFLSFFCVNISSTLNILMPFVEIWKKKFSSIFIYDKCNFHISFFTYKSKNIHFNLFESLRMLSGNIPNMPMQKLSWDRFSD